ncbi:MAG TPA: hypothetical protein VGQ17_14055 [Gemmatimonadales bacterium]|jgi:hypothetical protein|nr:hypothetical protein [Gemmatimonadales bacterium]
MLSVVTMLALVAQSQVPAHDSARAEVRLDAGRHEVVVTAGPFSVHAMPPGMTHEDMDMSDAHSTPLIRFQWPVAGWFRGFAIEILDASGKPIDRRLVHHLIAINFDRRQLLYSAYERIFGIGQETEDAYVPKTIGVPMKAGEKLGMYLSWDNETGKDLDGVQVRLRLAYSPTNLNPRPLDALPIYMDVNETVGGDNQFDVPPGRSEKAWEFIPSVSGYILGVGGHLHDYGVSVRLEDAETGKVLTRIDATRAPDGKLQKIGRKLFAVKGKGLRLKEGHHYRVVGVYDNPTGQLIRKGAMAHMVGLFVPDDYTRWPRIDLSDPTLQEDLAALEELGAVEHRHPGGR